MCQNPTGILPYHPADFHSNQQDILHIQPNIKQQLCRYYYYYYYYYISLTAFFRDNLVKPVRER